LLELEELSLDFELELESEDELLPESEDELLLESDEELEEPPLSLPPPLLPLRA
jgi:hypothetical protein